MLARGARDRLVLEPSGHLERHHGRDLRRTAQGKPGRAARARRRRRRAQAPGHLPGRVTTSQAPRSPSDRDRHGAREALWAAGALVLSLGVGKTIARAGVPGFVADSIYTLLAAFQIYVPLWLIQRAGEAPE